MKKYAIRWILLFAPVLVNTISAQQGQSSPCKEEIRQVYQKMNALGEAVPPGKTYHLDYTVEANLRQRPNQAGKERIRVFMNESQLMMCSKQLDYFADGEQTFKIVHAAKRIYWTASERGLGGRQRLNKAFILRDSLLGLSDVVTCTEEKNETGHVLKKIVLVCTPAGLRLLNYRQVTFWISEAEMTAVRMTILFGKSGDLNSVDFIFNKIDLDFKGTEMPVSFKNYLLQTNGKLKGKYKDYQLTDLRHKN